MLKQQSIHPLDISSDVLPAVMGMYGVSTPRHEMPLQIEYIQANPQSPEGWSTHGGQTTVDSVQGMWAFLLNVF